MNQEVKWESFKEPSLAMVLFSFIGIFVCGQLEDEASVFCACLIWVHVV